MTDRKRFDQDDRITAMVAAAYALVAKLERGETVSLAEIERATGLVRYEGSWHSIIGKLKRRSERERGITLWPVSGGGAYKLCTKDEQLHGVTRARNRRARKQLLKGLRSLECMPADELTLHDQQARAMMILHLRQGRSGLRKDAREEDEFVLHKSSSGLPPMTR